MKHLNWGVIFAGLSAVAGVAYVLYQMKQGGQQPVTNVFPPLNTPDFGSAVQNEPSEPQSINPTSTTNQNTPQIQPVPVFLV